MCGVRKQIGVPITKEMQACRRLVGGKLLEPEAERLARNLAELGDARIETAEAWDLRLSDAEHRRAQEVLQPAEARPIVAFSIGTKVQANDWGKENWRALMERLGARYPGYALVLIGASEEIEACEFVADGWRKTAGAGSPVINLCGVLTPRESAACLARAAVFLGHDSGPAHLAAAAGSTCVAVFSARNLPGMWFPHGKRHRILYREVNCMGCGLETCVVERKKCLMSITVEEVEAEVRAVLG
jgi:ADP-heptose:LPS heptosyltransferase